MKLATYLSAHGLTPAVFAARVGVPASTITRLIRGERSPRVETISKIETATGGAVGFADFAPPPAPDLPKVSRCSA